MVRVVQGDGHRGVAQRPPVLRAGEDDILHASAPQLLDPLLPQDPAHSVRHIALTAPVGTHDPGDTIVKIKHDLICKRFKALYLYTF